MTHRFLPLAVCFCAVLVTHLDRPTSGETIAVPGSWTQARLLKFIHNEDGVIATVDIRGKKSEVRVRDSATVMIQGRKAFFRQFMPGSEVWIQTLENRTDFVIRAGDAYSYVLLLRRRSFDAKVIAVNATGCVLETADDPRMTRGFSPKCTFWGPEGEAKAHADLLGREVRVVIGERVETVEAIVDREGLGYYILQVIRPIEEKANRPHPIRLNAPLTLRAAAPPRASIPNFSAVRPFAHNHPPKR